MLDVEDWAEIRRLHLAEGLPIKEIVRRTGLARNTVRSAVRSDGPPVFDRKPRPSAVDAVDAEIRVLLAEFPRMPRSGNDCAAAAAIGGRIPSAASVRPTTL